MRIAVHYDYAAAPELVAGLLADRGFLLEAAQEAGATSCQIDVAPEPSGEFTLTARVAGLSSKLPPPVRALAPHGLEIRQAQVWEAPRQDGTRRATVAGEIVGAPIRITGHASLAPTPGGARLAFACEVKADVPLLGQSIEQAATPAVLSYLAAQHAAAERRLAVPPA
ncbi:MAG: DUF2505 domain-containing protein [Bifidobacteriaceae bacterium]|jgi:hypothetical protein|nr:DUF2505 domain-containing protein [Bifidobacteriaceae bacterium]